MKTPESYYKTHLSFGEGNNGGIQRFKSKIIETIKQAQIDAIEEAVKKCADDADADCTYLGDNLKEIGGEYIEVYVIKSSILQVADKLKKELEP